MKIAILSRGDGWHVQDLLRAAKAARHDAHAWDFRTLHSESLPKDLGAIIARTMPAGSLEQIVFRMDLLHDAESRQIRVINPPRALEACVDKFLTNVRLVNHGLPVPRTIVAQTVDDAMNAFDSLGRDVVVKPLFGSEGRGMVRITDSEIAWRTFQTLATNQCVFYVQEFIRHPGWDIRAFVVRDRVVASMKRSHAADWRTNVAQGGTAEPFDLPEPLADLAVRAATAVGAWVAGVDLIQNEQGHWKVLEVNAAPGWRALANVCNIDIAAEIIGLCDDDTESGISARIAALWEAQARKVGNVHPKKDFLDLNYFEMKRAASTLDCNPPGSLIDFEAHVKRTRAVINTNANLGIIMLLAPMMALPRSADLRRDLHPFLLSQPVETTENLYRAIRLAKPGGLGKVDNQDMSTVPTLPLVEVMKLAQDRDLIARQFVNGYQDVFEFGVPALLEGFERFRCIEGAIIHSQLCWLAKYPDSLIIRKRGVAVAEDVRRRAEQVVALGGLSTADGRAAGVAFDAFLRSDGHALNPGTTADLIAASLYVALRDGLLDRHGPFHWIKEGWL